MPCRRLSDARGSPAPRWVSRCASPRPAGIDPVLVTCDATNTASARTITSCGGVLEDERDGVLRHWVRTDAPAQPIGPGPIETREARLVPVTSEEAAAMRAGERRADWAEGYPREDDLDAVGMMPSGPDAWTPRHIVRQVATGSSSARSAASGHRTRAWSRSATASSRTPGEAVS